MQAATYHEVVPELTAASPVWVPFGMGHSRREAWQVNCAAQAADPGCDTCSAGMPAPKQQIQSSFLTQTCRRATHRECSWPFRQLQDPPMLPHPPPRCTTLPTTSPRASPWGAPVLPGHPQFPPKPPHMVPGHTGQGPASSSWERGLSQRHRWAYLSSWTCLGHTWRASHHHGSGPARAKACLSGLHSCPACTACRLPVQSGLYHAAGSNGRARCMVLPLHRALMSSNRFHQTERSSCFSPACPRGMSAECSPVQQGCTAPEASPISPGLPQQGAARLTMNLRQHGACKPSCVLQGSPDQHSRTAKRPDHGQRHAAQMPAQQMAAWWQHPGYPVPAQHAPQPSNLGPSQPSHEPQGQPAAQHAQQPLNLSNLRPSQPSPDR